MIKIQINDKNKFIKAFEILIESIPVKMSQVAVHLNFPLTYTP